MEAQTAQPPTGSGPWVMLEQYSNFNVGDTCSAVDVKTMAAARTSIGDLIQFSLHLSEPHLAASRVRIQAPDDNADDVAVEYTCMVVAAHGDSLLIHVGLADTDKYSSDYFVYNAGDAAAEPPRPPSLSLLPPVPRRPRHLRADATGLLCCGDDKLVVAELKTVVMEDRKTKVAELSLFRSGEWTIIHPPMSYGDTGRVQELPSLWSTVFPVGDRQLCWVQLCGKMVICDVFEENPRLKYVRLPVDPYLGRQTSKWNANVCAIPGGGALKFVNIFPRCCCGAAGASNCKRSHHAYTIHTWMLRMTDDGSMDMEWVKDGIIDATELWALDAYKGLPRVPLDHPVISMDEQEPHVVYFQLCERHHADFRGDRTLWLLKVDVRSKTIQPVSCIEEGFSSYRLHSLIPTNVLHFFNSYPSNTNGDCALREQRQMGINKTMPAIQAVDDEQLIREDNASNPPLQSSFAEPSEQESEFLEAFLEISRYGLGDDELKAYIILSHDNGRRFKSLLRLPKNLRKD